MHGTRRRLVFLCLGGAAAFLVRFKAISAQSPISSPPPPRRRDPGDREEPAVPPGGAKKAMLEQNQKDIKKDIEKLYELASELKTEVEKTDATAVLSVAMVKKAEEIEKLARQIKDHAKG